MGMYLYFAVAIGLLVYNLIVFFVYGYDKRCAKKGKWRVPEKVLIGLAVCLGGIGAFLGMQIFRHKTKHNNFKIIVPLCAIVQIVVLGVFM